VYERLHVITFCFEIIVKYKQHWTKVKSEKLFQMIFFENNHGFIVLCYKNAELS